MNTKVDERATAASAEASSVPPAYVDLDDIEALREAVRVGDASGPSIPAEEVFAELRAMITERRADLIRPSGGAPS